MSLVLARKLKKLEEEVELWKQRAESLYWEQEMLRQEIASRPDAHEMARLAIHCMKLTQLLDFHVEGWREELEEPEPQRLRLVGGVT